MTMKKRFRHRVVFFLFPPFFRLFLKIKLNATAKKFKPPKGIKGPYLILSNHGLALDPFLLALSFREPIYFVASDMIFSIKYWSKLITYLVSPIPKTKYRSDMETIRDMVKVAKSGGSIGIFPEGNATFNGETLFINPSIAKLIKLLKLPVIFYHIEGGSLTKPRWSKHVHKGKVVGYVHDVWTLNHYQDLSVDDIYKGVLKNLYVNDHDLQAVNQIDYKGKDLALDIESSYFYCPSCQALNTLSSHKDTVSCTVCDFLVKYTTKGTFEAINQTFYYETTIPWYHMQNKVLREKIASLSNESVLFNDSNETILEVVRSKRKTPLGKAEICLTKETLSFTFNDHTETWQVKNVNSSVQQKNKLIFYDKETKKTYYAIANEKRNALKYVIAIDAINNKGEY
jgi:1-acyl-sn-glycerol-3-phosphate acyltransferase